MYHVGSVHVNGVTLATPAAAGALATYLDLTELVANSGVYTVTVHNTDVGATLVGTVGTINFGHHEAFVAQNFII